MTEERRSAPANPFDNPAFRREFGEALDEKLKPLQKTQQEHGRRITAVERRVLLWAGALTVLVPAASWAAIHYLK